MGHGEASGEAKGSGTRAGGGFANGARTGCVVGGMICLVVTLVLIVLGFFALSITKIVMGAVYIDDCPKEKMIPIFLIVSGACSCLHFGLYNFKPKKEEDPSADKPKMSIFGIISFIGLMFNFAWLICGSVWVFPHYSDIIDGCPGETECCVEKLARFSLAMVIIDWLFIVLFILLIVFSVVFATCMKPKIGDT